MTTRERLDLSANLGIKRAERDNADNIANPVQWHQMVAVRHIHRDKASDLWINSMPGDRNVREVTLQDHGRHDIDLADITKADQYPPQTNRRSLVLLDGQSRFQLIFRYKTSFNEDLADQPMVITGFLHNISLFTPEQLPVTAQHCGSDRTSYLLYRNHAGEENKKYYSFFGCRHPQNFGNGGLPLGQAFDRVIPERPHPLRLARILLDIIRHLSLQKHAADGVIDDQ